MSIYEEENMNEKNPDSCIHVFELARTETEQTNHGADSTGFFYKKVAYVICVKCGKVIKQDV